MDGRDATPLAAGASIGRFSIVRRIGAGGMGTVYEARDPELARSVAVKVIAAPDARRALRFLREAQALAQLQHPNVVAVHDVGTEGEQVYLAMELVDGESLERRPGPRPWREVLPALVQAGRGLAAAHAKGLVHRDVKPANILLGKDGRVRIGDFGLARVAGPDEAKAAEPAAAAGDAVGARAATPAITVDGEASPPDAATVPATVPDDA
ncbi:MAG TPA: serine/threonine-protein kinase, partial [Kofleriaceae bacterium]|nr:serine/threonine-protein kinase [Kofleriaceae bacterium]